MVKGSSRLARSGSGAALILPGCAAVDEKLLGPFLAAEFGLSPEQAQKLARDPLASEVTIEESARITIQSVGFFIIFSAALQVFGD